MLTSAAELAVIYTPPRQVIALVGRSVSCRPPAMHAIIVIIRSRIVSASAAGYVVPTDIGQSRRRESAADYSKNLGE